MFLGRATQISDRSMEYSIFTSVVATSQWWANPKSNPQPQILNLWTSIPNLRMQIPNLKDRNQIKSPDFKSQIFSKSQTTYYGRKKDGQLCSVITGY